MYAYYSVFVQKFDLGVCGIQENILYDTNFLVLRGPQSNRVPNRLARHVHVIERIRVNYRAVVACDQPRRRNSLVVE